MKTHKDRIKEKGAVAPMVAIMLVLIIVCVALVVDLGHIHNVKVQLQRAVDSAALAAAEAIFAGDPVAAAVAVGANNTVDREGVTILPGDVVLGTWDKEALGATPAERFDDTGTPPNAAKVTASRVVDHVFFFFLPSTTVTADAIAVDLAEVPTIPLAVISCIPTTGPQAGELTACGIKTYTFSSNENTAGWTALTAGGSGGASQQEIQKFFDEKREFFNEVVGLLETANVAVPDPPFNDSYDGCEGNFETTVNCGLGGDFLGYIPPSGIDPDPLIRYSTQSRHLPHYITTNSDELQAFSDIVLQDGELLWDKDNNELFTEYQDRLEALYNGNDNPFGDSRFQPVDEDKNDFRLIGKGPDKFDQNENGDTKEEIFIPDFNKIVDYAGYPPVSATTGSMASVMDTLVDQVADYEPGDDKKDIKFNSFLSHEVFPFNGDGETGSGARGDTILFYVPVIFAGACDSFDPNSHDTSTAKVQEDNELHYVGIANFLVTRIWKGGGCYRNDSPVTITSPYPFGPDPDDQCTSSEMNGHVPAMLSDAFTCPMGINPLGSIAFEALIRPPLTEAEEKGVRRIVLVE